MIAVGQPEHLRILLAVGAKLARAREGRVTPIHVGQSRLRPDWLTVPQEYADVVEKPALLSGHNAAGEILEHIRKIRPDLLLLHWSGQPWCRLLRCHLVPALALAQCAAGYISGSTLRRGPPEVGLLEWGAERLGARRRGGNRRRRSRLPVGRTGSAVALRPEPDAGPARDPFGLYHPAGYLLPRWGPAPVGRQMDAIGPTDAAAHTRVRYSPDRVSTCTTSPCSTKRGTSILRPVSRMTVLVAPVAVSPA